MHSIGQLIRLSFPPRLLFCLGMLFSLPGAFASAAGSERPNIVLIMADDQGWGETGYNGHPQLKTPVLDEMSRAGLRLDRFYAGAPVCKNPRVSSVPCVTSDIFPTVLDLLHLKSRDPLRPIDGISLRALLVDDSMQARPSPIGFWKYPAAGEKKNGRWIDVDLARGTTPTTRNPAIDFLNYRHPVAKSRDFGGEAAWTDNRYKLIVGGQGTELYDLAGDPKEQQDIAAQHPAIVKEMTAQLETWQRFVERSLSGADY